MPSVRATDSFISLSGALGPFTNRNREREKKASSSISISSTCVSPPLSFSFSFTLLGGQDLIRTEENSRFQLMC